MPQGRRRSPLTSGAVAGRRSPRRRRMRRTWPQRILILVNCVIAVACAATAVALHRTFNTLAEIQRVRFAADPPGVGGLSASKDGAGPSGQAENFLVVGSDSRAG